MTPQELKNSILQLAIQGKLVEQRPEEGTGEELYQLIQQEKQKLIHERKIKKVKLLPEITENEKQFDIPESWKWVRVGSITTLNPKNEIEDDLLVGFVPMPCVCDGYRNEHTFEQRKWKSIKSGFTHFADNDIGVAKITPCFQNRKSVIFHNLPNGYGAGTTELSIVRVIYDLLSREYLLWFFKSDYFISNGIKSFTGTAGQQRIHKDYLSNCLIPLPPLAEQKRIVAKIEELLPLIDRYEKAWNKLEEFNKRFPDDLQKSLLQMAIQGKLVEQRSEEGTAEELFQQIQQEKQKLIHEGKIKKEKPLPEITEDEKPFDIPDSWKWIRFGECGCLKSGYAFKSNEYVNTGIQIVRISDLMENGISEKDAVYYPHNIALKNYLITNNSFLICLTGSIGKITWIRDNTPRYLNQRVGMFEPLSIFETAFLWWFLHTSYVLSQWTGAKTSTNGNIRNSDVTDLLFPLPPLAEQNRIVAKLEELLPLCEKLK